jgi:hypothetical protein
MLHLDNPRATQLPEIKEAVLEMISECPCVETFHRKIIEKTRWMARDGRRHKDFPAKSIAIKSISVGSDFRCNPEYLEQIFEWWADAKPVAPFKDPETDLAHPIVRSYGKTYGDTDEPFRSFDVERLYYEGLDHIPGVKDSMPGRYRDRV